MIKTDKISMSRAYSEVYAFINALGDEYKSKIPEKLYKKLEFNRDINYSPIYDKDKPIEKGQMSKEALSLIAALDISYWCDTDKKEELKRKLYENQKVENEKYNDIFKKQNESSLPIAIKKESIYHKIINFLKNIFHIK